MSATRLTDSQMVALVCDSCGRTLPNVICHVGLWQTLWTLAVVRGWSGHVGGPHRCPACRASTEPPPPSRVPSGRLQAYLHMVGDALVIRLSGDITTPLATELTEMIESSGVAHRSVVIDMRAVLHVDADAVEILRRSCMAAKKRGGRICLAAPSRKVLDLLKRADPDSTLDTFQRPEAALVDTATTRHRDRSHP